MNSDLPSAPVATLRGDQRASAYQIVIENYTVQQTAALTGLSEHTLRYYEKVGLMKPVRRQDSSGHRRYSAADITKLETLACLRAAGMPIDQMRRYFELRAEGAASAVELQELLGTHLQALRRHMDELQGHINYVERKIDYWRAVEEHDEHTAAQIAREVDQLVRGVGFKRG